MATTLNKTAADKVLSTLSRRKSPLTISELATKTGINRGTISSAVTGLEYDGLIVRTGTMQTGKRGRPAILFTASA